MTRKSIAKHDSIIKRRNFLPSLVFTILIWFATFTLIYFVDPFSFGAILIFFVLIFLGFLFTFSLLFGNTRRGLVISLSLSFFLILRYLGIGHFLNFLLIAGLAIVIEMLYSR